MCGLVMFRLFESFGGLIHTSVGGGGWCCGRLPLKRFGWAVKAWSSDLQTSALPLRWPAIA